MATRQYTSGNLQRKADFCVTYIPAKSGKIITTIHSKTAVLHGSKLHGICSTTLSDLHISYGRLEVTDTGGQYFVLQARIEAVVKAANPKTVAESLPELKKHAQYKTKADRFRRSRLYLPGDQAKLMLNAGIHKPDAKLKSQLIWHFPGVFSFPIFPKNFWDWYYEQKQSKEVIKFLDKDPERITKFRGSLDPCTELVQKIKELI